MASDVKFSEKYPKLNMLIGFIILVALIVGIVCVIQWLVDKFIDMIAVVSNMDAVVITAIITGGVSIIGVVISSVIGKQIEFRKNRQEYLAQKREQSYGEFTDMVYKLMTHTKDGKYKQEDMVKDLVAFSRQITLWGSKDVVKKWVQFKKNATDPEGAKKNLLLIDEIMNEMRKDLGVRKVGQKDLVSFFINDPENIKTGEKKK